MTAAVQGRVARFYGFLVARLSAPNAERTILLMSLALMLPSLDTGLAADDYLHQLILQGSHPLDGFDRPRLDIFRFCDPQLSPGFLRAGIFTWWDDPNTRLAFFRPVSALTHYVDFMFWPDSPWLMHLHCLLWGAVLLLGVRALYRQLVPDRFIGTLAFALYALDDARAWFVSWVASRNGVIAAAFSVWALLAYCRERADLQKARSHSWLALLLLALGLLAGEGAISICAFILGHALFLEQGPLRARLVRLWPYAVLLVAWRVGYRLQGYGVSGSSLYVDPTAEPLTYALRWLERGPVLLFAQIGGPWSDAWSSLFVFPRVRALLYVGALAALGCVGALCAPLARRDPLVRFGLFGALLSTLPASAVFPADRLLNWIAIGACLVLATLLAPILKGEPSGLPNTGVARFVQPIALTLVLCNLVFAPMLIPSRARGNVALRDVLARAELGVPADKSIEDKLLVYVNPPAVPLAAYTPITRAALHIPRARTQRILGTSTTEMTITRLDANTLHLAPRGGFLQNPASKLMWSPKRPFTAGERIPVGETVFTVRSVTPDRRPLEVDVRFDRSLDEPGYVFEQWIDTRYRPFTPPAVGQTVILPAADYMKVIFGMALPIEARFEP